VARDENSRAMRRITKSSRIMHPGGADNGWQQARRYAI
jgi:hypothetical protein